MIKLDKEKLINSYNNGDSSWLAEIEKQVKENEFRKDLTEEDNETIATAKKMIKLLWHMNYVIIETEEEDYARKYNEETYDIYSRIKIDLMQLLDYDDFWEEL